MDSIESTAPGSSVGKKNDKVVRINRRRKKTHSGHHGGSWKVAYADFVTAMMAFFMVMWLLSMDDSMKEAVEGYFANPIGFKNGSVGGTIIISKGRSGGGKPQPDPRLFLRSAEENRYSKLASDISEKVNNTAGLKLLGAKIETVMTAGGLRIELIESNSGQSFFENGSAQMTSLGTQALSLIGEELKGLGANLVLEGHTDSRPFGADARYTNWELSADRANAARRALEGAGVSKDRIVEVKGYADRSLRIPNNPYAPGNRRISILLPFSTDIEELDAREIQRALTEPTQET